MKAFPEKAVLTEEYSDHYVQFSLDKLGRLTVEGHMVKHVETEQRLEFMFLTDQTCIKPFLNDLKAIIQN